MAENIGLVVGATSSVIAGVALGLVAGSPGAAVGAAVGFAIWKGGGVVGRLVGRTVADHAGTVVERALGTVVDRALDTVVERALDTVAERAFATTTDQNLKQTAAENSISTTIDEILQSAHYSEAVINAHIPFMHHTILECDYSGLEYTFEDHDITLNIPEGAVAKSQKIHIEIDVTMYGPFAFPRNTLPISPIVWICLLEKDAKLKKPFQLILPHFLTGLTKDKLYNHQVSFAKAVHHNYTVTVEDGQMKYKFNPCESKPLFASSGNKSYAVLKSEHYCFYCLQANHTPELIRDAGYCLTRIERSASPQRNEVYFVATYFLKTCIQALKEQFHIKDEYKISRYDQFQFKDEAAEVPQIEFSIPHSDAYDQQVIALEPSTAQIKASDVDFLEISSDQMAFKQELKMYPPRMKMTVTMTNTTPFKVSITVTGCSSKNQLDMEIAFPLEVAPSSVSVGGAHQILLCQSHAIVAQGDKPKLKDALIKLLPLAAKWYNIGTFLGVKDHILKKIKRDEGQVSDDCLREMLSEWLKIDNPPPTWNDLADALEPLDTEKAQEIRNCIAK